jgi:hypothetical protein
VAHVEEHVVGVHVCVRRCPPPAEGGQHALFTCETRVKIFPHPPWSLRCPVRVVFVCARATRMVTSAVVIIVVVQMESSRFALRGAAQRRGRGAAARGGGAAAAAAAGGAAVGGISSIVRGTVVQYL